ncbi:CGNR zinc finger domain-containing protein [Streptomyces globisporus]|uniref:CGNR zinc finger domain-containing protein n=1 Tax=Streptomyces globisporus TaxID=1908 RepID=UPI00378DBDD3
MTVGDALLEALNSTPVRDGAPVDLWLDGPELSRWSIQHGGEGAAAEREWLRRIRDTLQAVVRGENDPDVLLPLLTGVRKVPRVVGARLEWIVDVEAERRLAVELVLEWARLQTSSPGRLRPCANSECRLFLLDRSRANTARWCSMKTCGNRLKARRHHERRRPAPPSAESDAAEAGPSAAPTAQSAGGSAVRRGAARSTQVDQVAATASEPGSTGTSSGMDQARRAARTTAPAPAPGEGAARIAERADQPHAHRQPVPSV